VVVLCRFVGVWSRRLQYSWWSFIPKTIYEQFRKVSNCYFLLIIVIQFIPVRFSAPSSS
jgi:phospholipid-transporting ATPase